MLNRSVPKWMCVTTVLINATWVIAGEWRSNIPWPEPPVVAPGDHAAPPSDAIVLFNGNDLAEWVHGKKWQVKDGYAEAHGGSIETKRPFGSCQLHVEFSTPAKVKGSGQHRGNSGIYFMKRYEVQILDSHENNTYFDGQCGAIYKQHPPLVNACLQPGAWQTYDIIFNAPIFDGQGKLVRPASFTVLHNNVLVQNHFELHGETAWHRPPRYQKHSDQLPLMLQFHGDPVRFRNLWIRPLAEQPNLWDSWKPSQATQD